MVVAVRCVVTDYAERVVAGGELVGEYVRLACQRHLDDLRDGHARGLRWDQDAADRALRFFGLIEHTKGEWKGRAIALEPWQEFAIGAVFGWMRLDPDTGIESRRFRVAYNEVARKNGKSTQAAGVANYLAFFDGEAGAEVYCAATKRDQARIVWVEAKNQLLALQKKSPKVRALITVLQHNLNAPTLNAKLEPLGADADSTDGLNCHGNVIDELHAHKNRDLWDVLEEAMAARLQPLHYAITTAGAARMGICWEQHEYGVRVLEGAVQDDAFFAFIATIDGPDEELLDEFFSEVDDAKSALLLPRIVEFARKANPNLGVSVKTDYIRNKVEKARKTPGLQNSTKRKHFNIWTEGSERWFSPLAWAACRQVTPDDDLRSRPCYLGLDLAGTTDLNARVLLWLDGEGGYDVRAHFWMPEDNVAERVNADHVPYDLWIREGWITATPGERRNDDIIIAQLERDGMEWQIEEVCFDPWQAGHITSRLEEQGVTMVTIPQTFPQLSQPSEVLESLIVSRKIRHDGNPVLSWMFSNVVADDHPDGMRKPSKKKSTERIDGVSATVNALKRAVFHDGDGGWWVA